MIKDMDAAERIVWQLLGPARLDDWYERLPNRPDWQQAIEDVRDILRRYPVSKCERSNP